MNQRAGVAHEIGKLKDRRPASRPIARRGKRKSLARIVD